MKKERKAAVFANNNETGIACVLPVPNDNPLTMKGVKRDDDDFNIICLSGGMTTFSLSMEFQQKKQVLLLCQKAQQDLLKELWAFRK